MSTQKVQSPKKDINYENIPTQFNEKTRQKNSPKKYKDNIINSKYKNLIHHSVKRNISGINYLKRNTLDINNRKNKKSKKNNITNVNKNNKTIDNKNKSNSVKNNIQKQKENTSRKKTLSKTPTKFQSIDNNNIIIKQEDDFLTRQSKYSAKKVENILKLQEKFHTNETKKLSKDIMFLRTSQNNNKKCSNDTSFISGLSCTKSMAEIENSIFQMYQWEKRRKEKIVLMQNLKDKQIQRYTYIPKIDKRSNILAGKIKIKNDYNENVFERLSKGDKISKEKKKILEELYKPTFQPKIYFNNKTIYRHNNKSNNKKKDKEKNDKEYIIKVNKINNDINKESSDNNNIEEDKIISDIDIMQNLLRNTIIRNMNNKYINKSAGKRNIRNFNL